MNKQEKKSPTIHRLRFARIGLAIIVLILLLGTFWSGDGEHSVFVKLQFIPAILALNAAVVIVLLLLTLLFGRVYCSVICPLGILQDVISYMRGKNPAARRRFSYRPPRNWLRYSVMVVFFLLLALGMAGIIGALPALGLLEPYSMFGRIASNLFAPIYILCDNATVWLCKQLGEYWIEERELWLRGWPTFVIAAASFILLFALAWWRGRVYCNTLCPVGALLSLASRWSLFGIRINTAKCVSCGLCAKQCKASCINAAEHAVDASLCVACMNCLDACSKGAISYGWRPGYKGGPAPVIPQGSGVLSAEALSKLGKKGKQTPPSPTRREFLKGTGIALASAAAAQPEKLVDGGLAPLVERDLPQRRVPIVPPGAKSLRHLTSHCTGCQLCITACPNGVLRPSATLSRLMQPECSYERGYCRPECTRCSQVCPAGAMEPVHKWEKSSIQVGHAVWQRAHCVVLTDGVSCGNCARHCPVGAITMVPLDAADPASLRIPVINEERCIGCGACEHLCPARPHSAIYVEGHEVHRTL